MQKGGVMNNNMRSNMLLSNQIMMVVVWSMMLMACAWLPSSVTGWAVRPGGRDVVLSPAGIPLGIYCKQQGRGEYCSSDCHRGSSYSSRRYESTTALHMSSIVDPSSPLSAGMFTSPTFVSAEALSTQADDDSTEGSNLKTEDSASVEVMSDVGSVNHSTSSYLSSSTHYWPAGSAALTEYGSLAAGGVLLALLLMAPLISGMEAAMWRGWTFAETVHRIPADLWALYTHVLDRYPVPTKAVTSAIVYTIGDILAQRSEYQQEQQQKQLFEGSHDVSVSQSMALDSMRTFRSMAAGLIGHGPLSHVWYNVCDGFFSQVLHWTAWWVFLPKILVDQTLWSPIWNNSYILLLGLMKGDSAQTMWNDVKRTTIPLVVSGWKLWPAAHMITYGLIPVENRLLWVDTVEILWVTILATQAAGKTVAAPPAVVAPLLVQSEAETAVKGPMTVLLETDASLEQPSNTHM